MSDILMKEMESVSLSAESKEDETREGFEDSVSSFLLVDEHEKLRVKFASVLAVADIACSG